MRTTFAVIGFVVVAMVVGTCVACADDEDESSWVPQVEASERPGGRDGPARDHDDEEGGQDCDDQACNQHSDCENNSGECSDDDQLVFAPTVCAVPDSCRFEGEPE